MGVSIFIMVVTNTEHPPAAGTALGLLIPGWTLSAVTFILLSAIILSIIRLVLRPKLITSALGVGQSTVERIRKRCVEEGVESALNRKKQLRRRQKRLDGEGEARLIAMACGEPPEGRASWTLKLLADQLVECEIVGTISTETVRQALKKKTN